LPVSFLTEEQERQYGRYADEPSREQLSHYFHFDDGDRAFINSRRGAHMRLGCAIQLGTVRFLGTFLEDPTDVPLGMVRYVAEHLEIETGDRLAEYRTSRWRWRHPIEIREKFGYCLFADGFTQFRLNRWLYALYWTGTNRPSVLFDRAITWLLVNKVLLPGLSVLERAIARIRARANSRLWRRLTADITVEQRIRLDALLIVPEVGRQSPLDRLRNGPVLTSSSELLRAIVRFQEVQELANDLPSIDLLPPTRVAALARFASAARAQAVARLPDDRRLATLLAFIRTLEASSLDDVLDLYDVVVTRIFADAAGIGKKARLRSIQGIDTAAIKLGKVGNLILNEGIQDVDLRTAIFEAFPREELASAVAQVSSLTRSDDVLYFGELRAQKNRLRFLLPLLTVINFGAAVGGKPLLDAARYLRGIGEGKKQHGPPPTSFVPKKWRSQVRSADGSLDLTGYKLCFLDRLRHAVRRRDVFVSPSLRYADPRKGLLEGLAWENTRSAICRTIGVSPNGPEQINQLTEQLNNAYLQTINNLSTNANVRFEDSKDGPDLVLTGLDKLDEPPSLVALREAVAARLPRVDLPEILLEIHARTDFAAAFTHVSEGESRARDLVMSVCGILVAEACNIGLEPIVHPDVAALRRSRLSWVRHNFIRADTLTAANAKLVAAQNNIALARTWGGGDVASADGLRFVVPVRTIHSGPNPKYFGKDRGVTYYNLVSDQYTGLNGIVVPGTLRDSLHLLALVLEQETDHNPTEIMTDTGAYTDIIFGIFWLLGYQFSPRLADIGGQRFWRIDPKADYGTFNDLSKHKGSPKLIIEHYDDLLRLAGSLKLGVVQVSALMRTLQTRERPTKLSLALQELGRIIKTLYLLNYIDDEDYRRRILRQLNRGESRHALARIIFHGQRGELRQRYREGQEDQLGALGLVTNIIVLWNTIYMDAALDQLRSEGFQVSDGDAARLSPLGHDHMNVLGRYAFSLPETVMRGELRPLRNPEIQSDDGP
jgi:TnpA family transposase